VHAAATSAPASPLQSLQTAAANQYDPAQNFDVLVDQPGDAPQTAGSAPGYQLSGSFQSGALVAVGSVSEDGQVTLFPQAQIQSEESDLAQMRQTSYSDSLQNFMMLAQAGETNGQVGAATYADQQQFTGDNGLISASFDTSLTLTPT
jgi:hypothetical protein